MQKRILWLALTLMVASTLQVKAQYDKQDSTYKNCLIGSSLFIAANLKPDNDPPDFYQPNLDYRITGKDVSLLEIKT